MARRQRILIVIIGCFLSGSLFVAPPTQAAQPASPVASPVSATCDVGRARSFDELRVLAGRGLAASAAQMASPTTASPTPARPTPGVPLATPAGQPADAAMTAEVTTAITTFFVCINEGRAAAAWSVMPDSWVSRQLAGLIYAYARGAAGGAEIDPATIEPEFIDSALTLIYYGGSPIPPAERSTVNVRDVRDLGNGRVRAEALVAIGGGEPSINVIELERTVDGYLLVDPRVDAALAATPVP